MPRKKSLNWSRLKSENLKNLFIGFDNWTFTSPVCPRVTSRQFQMRWKNFAVCWIWITSWNSEMSYRKRYNTRVYFNKILQKFFPYNYVKVSSCGVLARQSMKYIQPQRFSRVSLQILIFLGKNRPYEKHFFFQVLCKKSHACRFSKKIHNF